MCKKGYFGIGIENGKWEINYGTLFRSAQILGASFVFTIGERFRKQKTDTTKSWLNVPTFQYQNFQDFYKKLPYGCELIGVELADEAINVSQYQHPRRACYLLGAEDVGLSDEALDNCDCLIRLHGDYSLNVSVAGSIVMYDRLSKGEN